MVVQYSEHAETRRALNSEVWFTALGHEQFPDDAAAGSQRIAAAASAATIV